MVKIEMLFFSSVIIAVLLVANAVSNDEELESSMRDLLARRKNLDYVKTILQDLDYQLKKLQKRTCYFNAGMSHSCDYKDLVSAVGDQNYWASDNAPGRKKREGTGQNGAPALPPRPRSIPLSSGSDPRLERLYRSLFFDPRGQRRK